MRTRGKRVMGLEIIMLLVGILVMPLAVWAEGNGNGAEEVQLQAEETPALDAAAGAAPEDTAWGAPVLVSPNSSTYLYHYPRTTTLAWQPVTGANSYKVERWFLSGSTYTAYAPVIVNGFYNTSYTFDFVGDQKGRWRVTAYTGSNATGTASPASAYWYFYYNTIPQMATPTLTNPYSSEVFYHFPRTTTLSWKMIPSARAYRVEVQFCTPDKVTCVNHGGFPVEVAGPLDSSHTFTFVGAQPGKWRVTALGTPGVSRDSAVSAWRWFSYAR